MLRYGLLLGAVGLFFSGVMILLPFRTENEFLAGMLFFEAIPDVERVIDCPHERIKRMREMGTQGATVSESDREILVAKLVYEYKTSPDPNMRREAVDALKKIPHPLRDRFLQNILQAPYLESVGALSGDQAP